MKTIRLKNIKKQYGVEQATILAIQDINIWIQFGEFVAVMGES